MKTNNAPGIKTLFRLFTLVKIPMIFYTGAKIVELDENKAVVKIPLNFRTKNHLRSMYFGVLAVGADVAGGIMAIDIIRKKKLKFNMVFKDMKADFLKRAESAVHFVCEDGQIISRMIDRAISSGNREEEKVHIKAYSNYNNPPGKKPQELVAEFILTISFKDRK